MDRRALAALVCMTAAANAVAADKVKVGLLTTLSGPGAALGNEIRDGFNLALQHTGGKLGGLRPKWWWRTTSRRRTPAARRWSGC